MADTSHEGLYKLVELINAQSDSVWVLSLGLIYAGFVILAQLLKDNSAKIPQAAIISVMALGALSILLGYTVKGALIHEVREVIAAKEWSVSLAAKLSFFQAMSPLLGAVILVGLVLLCTQVRTAVVSIWAK